MKILLINKFHYLRGGAERAYFDMGKILEEAGHEVAYFSTKNEKNLPSKWEKYFVTGYDLGVKQSFVNKIKIIINIFYNFEARKNLKKLLQEFQPDIAHLHNIYHHLSPSIILELKKQKIPMVMTLHDYKLICPNYNLFSQGKIWEKSKPKKYYKCLLDRCVKNSFWKSLVSTLEAYAHDLTRVYKKVDIYISPSRFLADKFREYKFTPKIRIFSNPIIIDEEILNSSNKIDTENYALYFGRLSQEKGIDDLIKAFKKIGAKLNLVIAGDGPDRQRLEKLARGDSRIKFVGFKKDQELWELVKKAKMVVFPSKCYENASYSLLEAMTLTKTVICANIGGISEWVHNEKTGYLYEPGDFNKLANIIENLAKKDNNKEIEKRAREMVAAKNNKTDFYKELINIYNTLIKKYE